MSFQIKQKALYKGNDFWKWSVWLDGPAEELKRIASVTYTLHPTFPQPIAVVDDRSSKFRLDATGWGEFDIKVAVKEQDGSVKRLGHWLELKYPQAKAGPRTGGAKKSSARSKTTVYVTGCAADAEITRAVADGLVKAGFNARTANDSLDAGSSIEAWLQNVAEESDACVAVISEVTSPWLVRELDVLRDHEVTIVPLFVGQTPHRSGVVEGVQGIAIADPTQVKPAIAALVKALRSRPLAK